MNIEVFRATPSIIHAGYIQHEYQRSLVLISNGQDLCGRMQQYISRQATPSITHALYISNMNGDLNGYNRLAWSINIL